MPTATSKWGGIGDWDVSVVQDFTSAFSKNRNKIGDYEADGNPKAVTFVGTDMSKWITTSATSLDSTFHSAGEMNADLSGWTVGKVTTMQNAFTATTSLTSCNKRRITDAWKDSRAFVATSYDTDWEGDTCTVRFKYRAAR